MRWLGQLVQAMVFFVLVGGFLTYVCAVAPDPDRPTRQGPSGQGSPACAADPAEVESAALQPDARYAEYRDPRHLCVATEDQVPARRRLLAVPARRRLLALASDPHPGPPSR
jgi:hypothetical protein